MIPSRAQLEQGLKEVEARFPDGNIPLPPHWGGYRVRPEVIEFWQGRESRLHDRIRYTREGQRWRIERLSPGAGTVRPAWTGEVMTSARSTAPAVATCLP